MSKPPDFKDAHARHWQDAELLFEHHRWANADQLYGLSAECGLKAVMQRLDTHVVDDTGDIQDKYHIHVNRLWREFQHFANNHDGARYVEMLPNNGSPFENWAITDRYAKRDDFDQADVASHREAAEKILHIVSVAMQDR